MVRKEGEVGMNDREKIMRGAECCKYKPSANGCPEECPYLPKGHLTCGLDPFLDDVIALLKERESATVEPKQIELVDETKAWLDTMDAVDALNNIAIICIDWDGYRTANGLGELINEIWAYAQYCAKKLKEEQKPIAPKMLDTTIPVYWCGACGVAIDQGDIYCRKCGKPVKWE